MSTSFALQFAVDEIVSFQSSALRSHDPAAPDLHVYGVVKAVDSHAIVQTTDGASHRVDVSLLSKVAPAHILRVLSQATPISHVHLVKEMQEAQADLQVAIRSYDLRLNKAAPVEQEDQAWIIDRMRRSLARSQNLLADLGAPMCHPMQHPDVTGRPTTESE